MRNWKKWRAGTKARNESARRAAMARWDAYHQAVSAEPLRATRTVEITIRDSHRPMHVIILKADERQNGWSRFSVSEGGVRIGSRRFGRSSIASLIAALLQ